jgi:hypothetical protein
MTNKTFRPYPFGVLSVNGLWGLLTGIGTGVAVIYYGADYLPYVFTPWGSSKKGVMEFVCFLFGIAVIYKCSKVGKVFNEAIEAGVDAASLRRYPGMHKYQGEIGFGFGILTFSITSLLTSAAPEQMAQWSQKARERLIKITVPENHSAQPLIKGFKVGQKVKITETTPNSYMDSRGKWHVVNLKKGEIAEVIFVSNYFVRIKLSDGGEIAVPPILLKK